MFLTQLCLFCYLQFSGRLRKILISLTWFTVEDDTTETSANISYGARDMSFQGPKIVSTSGADIQGMDSGSIYNFRPPDFPKYVDFLVFFLLAGNK